MLGVPLKDFHQQYRPGTKRGHATKNTTRNDVEGGQSRRMRSDYLSGNVIRAWKAVAYINVYAIKTHLYPMPLLVGYPP